LKRIFVIRQCRLKNTRLCFGGQQAPAMRPTLCDFKKSLPISRCYGTAERPWHTDIESTRCGLENFERGEVVSPPGSIARKVSGPTLATPDARHRRPLKNFQYSSRLFQVTEFTACLCRNLLWLIETNNRDGG
jgi:hypothetical protein